MKATAKQLARILVDHLEGATDKQTEKILKEFVAYLAEAGILSMWRDIEQQIHTVWKEKYGASVVKVVSAHDLSKNAKSVIEQLASGADITFRTDERLIGGAVLRIDDKRIDGSISGVLRRLKTTLAS